MRNPFKNMSKEAKGVLTLSAVAVILFSSVATIGVALSRGPVSSSSTDVNVSTNPPKTDDEVNKIIEYVQKPVDEDVEVLHYYFDINYEKDNPKLKKALVTIDGKTTNSKGLDYYTANDKTFDIRAAHSGTVISITPDDRIYGTIVQVQSEDYIFYYSGLKKVNVKINEKISSGVKIGNAGECALSEGKGNILHFEVRLKDKTLNPENCFGKELKDL